MANKKTAKKINKKPEVGDIIKFSPTSEEYYLVQKRGISNYGGPSFYLLRLDTGYAMWYDYELHLRRWRKVA